MAETPLVVLSIAGFDPSSGAGVTADIKTIAAHGCYGIACITAMTVQSTSGVRRVEAVDPSVITETLEELTADIPIAAVHIGMLGSAKVVRVVADFLVQRSGKAKLPNVVLDPILKSSSGTALLDAPGTKLLIEKLIPLADVLTPNVDEAAALSGLKVTDLDEMRAGLGYEQIDLYGASYGTRVAELYMRRYPARVHAVILDGVTYPEQIIGVETPQGSPGARRRGAVDWCRKSEAHGFRAVGLAARWPNPERYTGARCSQRCQSVTSSSPLHAARSR